MAAAALNAPELALESDDAKAMSVAIAEVAKHYPMTIDPKTMAWINLASCAGMIYGPRIYLMNARKKEEAKAKKTRQAEANPLAVISGMGNA